MGPEKGSRYYCSVGFSRKKLTEKVPSLTKVLLSVRMECANLCAELDEVMVLVQQMKENLWRPLYNVSTEV